MRVSRRLAVSAAALVGVSLLFAPAATAAPLATSSATARVVKVVDGDTVKLSTGTMVRLIGFDTPEKGQCGYTSATSKLKKLVLGKKVKVTNPSSVKNTDKYGRALRSISVNGKDVGVSLISAGLANARYDSLNGYQKHPLQTKYRALDKKVKHKCGTKADKVGESKSSSSSKSSSASSGAWNRPGPDLDCSDIRKKVKITGKDYHRLDADGDGWGCDSWG